MRIKMSLLLLLFYSWKVFRISIGWRSCSKVWVTASLLKSPRLFSVYWPNSTMLYFVLSPLVLSVFWPISIMHSLEWSPLVLLFPSPPVLVSILWWLHVPREPITIGIIHGVMVIIIGNGHGDTSSNPKRDWKHFT